MCLSKIRNCLCMPGIRKYVLTISEDLVYSNFIYGAYFTPYQV